MDISVGLPSHLPGVERSHIIAWARRAEELGFTGLVVTDRLAWNQLEPLVVLAAAAAVTDRITLRTSVMLLPNRGESGPLAKQIASLQVLAAGRLEVGVGVGDRPSDYQLAGVDHPGRHRRIDAMLEEMLEIWTGEGISGQIGPTPSSDIPLMIGGSGGKTWDRVARFGSGWTFAVGSADDFANGVEQVRSAWTARGRMGRPRSAAQRYFNVGASTRFAAESFLGDYFSFLGRPSVDYLVASAPTDAKSVAAVAESFTAAGADELAFLPTSLDLDELDRLSDLLL